MFASQCKKEYWICGVLQASNNCTCTMNKLASKFGFVTPVSVSPISINYKLMAMTWFFLANKWFQIGTHVNAHSSSNPP